MYKVKQSRILKHLFLLLIVLGFLSACKSTDEEPIVPIVKRYTESIPFQSKVLNRPINYSIYLPVDYATSGKRYGTVYLLNGYGDDETDWMKDGRVDAIINELEKNGSIEPMIYIMPQGNNSYYVNRFNGTSDYMRMFTTEFVPLIDSLYRTKKDKSQRAVVGYSMGGYGALILPSKNPEIFSVSVPLSMSFRTDEQYLLESQNSFDTQWSPIYGGKGSFGNARLTDYYKQNSPFHFFAENNIDIYKSVHYYIDCGDDEESLSITNNTMHALMRNKNIPHEYRMRNGAHDWDYWRFGMKGALPFIQSCFTGTTYPQDTNFKISEAISGTLVQQTMLGTTLNICLPKEYATSGLKYPVIYYYHSVDKNRLTETKNTMAVLDSLQKEKPFILVEMDEAEMSKDQSYFQNITTIIDQTYRTKIFNYNRIGIGNKLGGKLIYDASGNYPELLYSVFLFDASLGNSIAPPVSKFIYLDCVDEAVNFESMQMLYSECRNRTINHQFRVRNGHDTYNSFLQGLDASIVYIGLMLNKL
jgi:enterochelin esterase-like enzyme